MKMQSELCPVQEHHECRRCDALYIAKDLHPKATTEEVIEEAQKLMKCITQEPATEIIQLVIGKDGKI